MTMGFFTENFLMVRMILCVLMVIELVMERGTVMGEVYKVGDSARWIVNSNSKYSDWASSKNFHVKDILLFEYNTTTDNVILVSRSDFRSCNTSAPIKTFNSGNDSFTIKSPGHYYFTCSFSGHCDAGQKLDVRVLKSSRPATTPPPTPSPSPSPSDSPATALSVDSKAAAPGPTNKAAAARDPKWWFVSTIAVSVTGLAGLVIHG